MRSAIFVVFIKCLFYLSACFVIERLTVWHVLLTVGMPVCHFPLCLSATDQLAMRISQRKPQQCRHRV